MNLEQRLERLERLNRRLTLAVFGLMALVGCAVTMGSQAKQNPPAQVKAKEFVLVDEQGKERGALRLVQKQSGTVVHTGPFLILSDSSGTRRFEVGCVEGNNGTNSVGFELKDNTGNIQVGADAMSGAKFQASLFLRHKDGAGLDLQAMPEYALLEVVDKRARAAPGVKLTASADARSVAIFDVRDVKEGVVKEVQQITLRHDKDGNRFTIFDEDGELVFSRP